MRSECVVVVGSGPCGATAASTLVRHGIGVVMLDAGLRAPRGLIVRAGGNTILRRMSWDQYAVDRQDPRSAAYVDWVSSLSLGGLSNYWTAAVPRFAPADFTDGAAIDERYRWPINYDDLVPYYADVERVLTITAGDPIDGVPANVRRFEHRLPRDWLRIMERAAAAGHALGALPMAKGRPWMVARRGTEFASYHVVIAPMLESPWFELVTGAHVTRLGWSPASGSVETVDYFDRANREVRTIPCRAVVVAAGAIDSTVLLLRSRSADFPNGLGNANGLVGRYLHDHPRDWWPASTSSALHALAHPLYVARGPFEGRPPLSGTSITLGLSSKAQRLRTYYRGRSRSFGAQVFGTMTPTPDLGVSIDETDAPDVRPRISLQYDSDAIAAVESARDRLRDVFAAAGITLSITGPFHQLRPGSSVHYGGTVRMHTTPQFGVLDQWNRVFDAPNVVVCDSSCFPTGPEKNPTLTAMAIAARAADNLARDLGRGRV